MKQQIYALYRGDDFLAIGTAEELAAKRGVKPETIKWLSYPCAKKRGNQDKRLVAERI